MKSVASGEVRPYKFESVSVSVGLDELVDIPICHPL